MRVSVVLRTIPQPRPILAGSPCCGSTAGEGVFRGSAECPCVNAQGIYSKVLRVIDRSQPATMPTREESSYYDVPRSLVPIPEENHYMSPKGDPVPVNSRPVSAISSCSSEGSTGLEVIKMPKVRKRYRGIGRWIGRDKINRLAFNSTFFFLV